MRVSPLRLSSLMQCFVPLLLFRFLCGPGGYNTQQWFESAAGGSLSPSHIGAWMSWIPVVFGSGGAVLGGVASDWLAGRARRAGRHGRGPAYQVALLVLTQAAAAPCAAGVLLLQPPYAFLMLFPTYLIGESYIGTCMAMLMDRTPAHAHSLVLSLYIFAIANLGGNAGLLLPPLQRALGGNMRLALLLLWPGLIVASGMVYALLWFCTRRDGTGSGSDSGSGSGSAAASSADAAAARKLSVQTEPVPGPLTVASELEERSLSVR